MPGSSSSVLQDTEGTKQRLKGEIFWSHPGSNVWVMKHYIKLNNYKCVKKILKKTITVPLKDLWACQNCDVVVSKQRRKQRPWARRLLLKGPLKLPATCFNQRGGIISMFSQDLVQTLFAIDLIYLIIIFFFLYTNALLHFVKIVKTKIITSL